MPVIPIKRARLLQKLSPKKRARLFKALRKKARMWMFRQQQREIMEMSYRLGITRERMEEYLQQLEAQGLRKKEIPQKMMADFRELEELAPQWAQQRGIRQEQWQRAFRKLFRDYPVQEVLAMMQRQTGAAA